MNFNLHLEYSLIMMTGPPCTNHITSILHESFNNVPGQPHHQKVATQASHSSTQATTSTAQAYRFRIEDKFRSSLKVKCTFKGVFSLQHDLIPCFAADPRAAGQN